MLAWDSLKEIEEFAAEHAAEDLHREKKKDAWGEPSGSRLDRNRRQERRSGDEDVSAGSVPTCAGWRGSRF